MVAKHFTKNTVLAILLLLCPFASLFAADESYIQSKSGPIKKGDSVTVIDDKFLHLPLKEWNGLNNLSVLNIISFELRQDTAVHFDKPFTCTLNITIKYFTSRDQQKPEEINNVDMVVRYDTATGAYYPADTRYSFKNAFKVTVIVNSINSPEWGDKLPPVFRIRNQILIQRKYPWNPDTPMPVNIQQRSGAGKANKTSMRGEVDGGISSQNITSSYGSDRILAIDWPAIPGAEEYDLEWTYIDKQSAKGLLIINTSAWGGETGPFNIPPATIEEWMRNDNTRVTITGLEYNINLPYTDGYVITRVRSVSYQAVTNLRLQGAWQYTNGSNTSCVHLDDGHQENLNWQYVGSFAEEGKRKEVISYFDASLRSRQVVTINNSDNVGVVAETIYDKMGRAAANILPAPTELPVDKSPLSYYPSFNMSGTTGQPYSHADISFSDLNCEVTANSMATTSGASQYYSAQNPFINSTNFYFSKFVPDASGYPFTVTQYTADNTGRIRKQSGVGPEFTIEGEHATKYYYGKPLPKDLYRLFGMEVGDASHYLKNMVIDANGQASVSYVNAAGKTIATALAGASPDNLDELPSAAAPEAKTRLNQALIKSTDFIRDAGNLKMQASATFLAAVEGEFIVKYHINPAALITTPQANAQFCSNCYYDVLVEIRDDCGNLMDSESSPPFDGSSIDVSCNPNPTIISDELSFNVTKRGEYHVTYTLRLNDDVINQHTDYYIQHNSDLKKIQDFFQEELDKEDLMACYSNCIDCEEKLGTLTQFTEKMQALLTKLNAEKYPTFATVTPFFPTTLNTSSPEILTWINDTYEALYENCQLIKQNCKPESPCEQKLSMLKMDVMPGGQYAIYDPVTFLVPTTPFDERQVSVLLNYKTDPNITDFAFIDEDGVARHIKDLAVTESMFIKAYIDHPEWADDFVKRHVEYCSYIWCKDQSYSPATHNNEVSYTFDEMLKEVVRTGDQAIERGFFDPNDQLALLDADPFFNGGRGTGTFKTQMASDLNNLSDVLQFIVYDAGNNPQSGKHILKFVDWMLYCKPTDPNATANDFVYSWNNCDVSSECRSRTMEWERYRDYYIQLKSKYVRLAKLAWDPTCDNCYIGNDGLSQTTCTPPGNLNDYDLRYESLTGGGYQAFLEYQSGTLPFMSNYIITYTRFSASLNLTVTETKMVTQRAMSVLLHEGQEIEEDNIQIVSIECVSNTIPGDCNSTSTGGGGELECPITGTKPYAMHTVLIRDNGVVIGAPTEVWDRESNVYISLTNVPTTVPVKVELKITETNCNGTGPSACNTTYITQTITIIPPGTGLTLLGSNLRTGTLINSTPVQYINLYTRTIEIVDVYCDNIPSEDPPTPPSYCAADPRAPYYKHKIRRFNEYIDNENYLNCTQSNLPTTPPSPTDIAQVMRNAALANLNDAIPNWLNTLKGVRDEEFPQYTLTDLTDALLNDIITHCALIAKKYIEIAPDDNIRAACNLPPGYVSDGGYESFYQVFKDLVPSNIWDEGFGDLLLGDPYPYDKTPFTVNPTVIHLSTELCTNVGALEAQWQIGGAQGTFHEYLQQELKEDYILTEAQLNDILARCEDGCTLLNEPLIIPVAFATPVPPNADHPFVDCNRINTLLDDLNNEYAALPAVGTRLYRVIVTNYLNKALGYALSFEEYDEFREQCMFSSSSVLYNKAALPAILDDDFACVTDIMRSVFDRAGQEYERYILVERLKFRNAYISKCIGNSAWADLEGDQYEYHYTLYYYDQAGNLVKTIPPEGVKLLTEAEIELVETFYDDAPADCTGYTGPISENKPVTLNQVSGQWQTANGKSMEMWMYTNNGTAERKLRFVTPDNKFFYQAAIKDKKLWVELYSLLPGTGGGIEVVLSNQAYADISTLPPLQPWTHLVAQATSSNLPEGPMQLYLDGRKLTTVTVSTSIPAFPFEWEIIGGYTLPAEDVAMLKHLRLYRRNATDNEVWEDYKNSCLSPVGLLANWDYTVPGNSTTHPLTVWGRFNVPAAGSETTIGPGSTVEYVRRFIVPDHGLPTNYYYNSLNQVVKQQTPDAGISEFVYDRLGRLIVSQNAEQKTPVLVNAENPAGRHSYTKYDELGRITEVGEKLSASTISETQGRDESFVTTWMNSGTNRQVTVTAYDAVPTWLPAGITQKNLRKRVAASAILSSGSNPATNRIAASYFSYDISGNVDELTQENTALIASEQAKVTGSDGLKRMKYEYDLISGKVNKVLYQDGKWDQFYYQYLYDPENRVVKSLSSRVNYPAANLSLWTEDASYRYYLHGPLARTELGKHKVQGLDYAYTLQGWLKGVNSNKLNADSDMGKDGVPGEPFQDVAVDAIAFSLGYYGQNSPDYISVGASAGLVIDPFELIYKYPQNIPLETGRELYNGNISNATYAIRQLEYNAIAGYSYRYDQLNRLTAMRRHEVNANGREWSNNNINASGAYQEDISYDANGNIKTYFRNGAASAPGMDQLTYAYNLDANGRLLNNKLRHVTDEGDPTNYTVDIKDQPVDNYEYDAIGNLVKDNTPGEALSRINWTVYGKIANIRKDASTISYLYDASGNRIQKSHIPDAGDERKVKTYYVRDAQGNTMGVYEYAEQNSTVTGKWLEQHLYGSSRLGMLTPKLTITTPLANANYDGPNDQTENLGNRQYELTNHLGNVLAVISDEKTYWFNHDDPCGPSCTVSVPGRYQPVILSAIDYYPFGMVMPEREYKAGKYRYGFNGKENDDEVKGVGNQQDYGMRIYDTRIGKFLSVDPLTSSYPYLTPYQFSSNTPIVTTDLDGMEAGKGLNDVEKMRDGIGFLIKQKVTQVQLASRIIVNLHPVTKYAIKVTQEVTKQMVLKEALILHNNALQLDNAHTRLQEFYHATGFYSMEYAKFEERIDLSLNYENAVAGLNMPSIGNLTYNSELKTNSENRYNVISNRSNSYNPMQYLSPSQKLMLSVLESEVASKKNVYDKQLSKYSHIRFINSNGDEFNVNNIMKDVAEFIVNTIKGPQNGDREALDAIQNFFSDNSTIEQKTKAFGVILDKYINSSKTDTSWHLRIIKMKVQKK